jgi:hypothetical protein
MKGNEIIPLTPGEKAFNNILRFYTEGDITLSGQEELILRRWNHAHKLMLQRKYTEEQIKEKIHEIYGVTIHTAGRDIYQAQALFGGSINSNKKYLLHHHAENIMLTIERFKNDKSLVHLLPKMFDSYTKAIVSMPDEINKDKMPTPILNLIVVEGQSVTVSNNFEDAIARMKKRQEAEDIDHEDLKDE